MTASRSSTQGLEIEQHIDSIVSQAPGDIEWILVTHTHPDHSPGANLLRERTGAKVFGMTSSCDDGHQDPAFKADGELGQGDVLAPSLLDIAAIHTPGHASNHLVLSTSRIGMAIYWRPHYERIDGGD